MPDNLSSLAAIPTSTDDAHYLRAVTELGETREVIAQEAIYNERGVKLIEAGASIDRRMYQRLVEHRLQRPIDNNLSVKDGISSTKLVNLAEERLHNEVLERELARACTVKPLLAALEAVPLPSAIAFRLTLMREQRPGLFAHTLQLALLALYLGVSSKLDSQTLSRLAAAGLLHDLGMLHIDPALLDASHKLTFTERRYLVAHPLTSMLIAREQNCYPSTVLDAVLEHHERLDGTGYPRALRDKQVSQLGQLLLLAEVASGVFGKEAVLPAQRLSVILRLNHRKFERQASNHLLQLLGRIEQQATSNSLAPTGWSIKQLLDTLEKWQTLRQGFNEALPPQSAAEFIEMRLSTLQYALHSTGFVQDSTGFSADDDQQIASEMALLSDEARWQIENTLNGTYRRWPSLATNHSSAADEAAYAWCCWVQQQLGIAVSTIANITSS